MNEQDLITVIVFWLLVGLLLGELTSKKSTPLAYAFIVILWPVLLPLAIGLVVALRVKGTK